MDCLLTQSREKIYSLGVPAIICDRLTTKNRTSDSQNYLKICFQITDGSNFRYVYMYLPHLPTYYHPSKIICFIKSLLLMTMVHVHHMYIWKIKLLRITESQTHERLYSEDYIAFKTHSSFTKNIPAII